VNVPSFVLCGCPIIAKTAIPTSGAAKTADLANIAQALKEA
jgi:hypothetical protein